MDIERGTRMVPIRGSTRSAPIQIRVVRHTPISYAEVEPVRGGRIRAVSLRELERDFRILRDNRPVTDGFSTD